MCKHLSFSTIETGPVEEVYGMLNRFEADVDPEEQNRADTLRYDWDKLLVQATEVCL